MNHLKTLPAAMICVAGVSALLFVAPYRMAQAATAGQTGYSVDALRCEYHVDPLGIDSIHPRLQWIVKSARRAERQTAYRVLVASSPRILATGKGDLWDSGIVHSSRTAQVAYSGKPLHSGEECWWMVRSYNASTISTPSAWSAPAHWSMGLLAASDWKATWIGYDAAYTAPEVMDRKTNNLTLAGLRWASAADARGGEGHDAAYLRSTFALPADRHATRAVFVIYGDNELTAEINGVELGHACRWEQTALLDATPLVKPGDNVACVSVTNSDYLPPAAIGKIVVTFDSGDPLVFPIDSKWKALGQLPAAGWDKPGFDDSAWSVPSFGGSPWGTPELADALRDPAPYLRKTFTITKPVRRAVVNVTALGLYELHINGKRVGADYMCPGWTDFRKRVDYQTYDVTPLVKNGQNAIGAMLGNGWYAGCLAYTGRRNWYGGNARLLAQLVVEHTDGTVQTIATDSSWKAAFGPVRQADLLLGCVYDDRQSIAGWDLPGFNDHKWATVDSLTASGSGDSSDETARLRRLITNGSLSLTVSNDTMGGDPAYDQVKNLRVVYTVGGARKTVSVGEQEQLNLSGSDLAIVSATYGPATNVAGAPAKAGPIIEAQKSEPVRIQDVLSVVKLTQPKPGLWVFDLGQNMVGWTRLKISGTSGQKIVVLHGEMLNPDGTVYVANLRSATGADEYILSGNGVESLEPMFTLKGFRYVEVRGLTAPPTPDMVHGVVVYSNMARTGDFECSNPLVNQLYHNIIWGQKGNYIAVPTDCPQRDERAGWTGDTEFFMRTGAYNYDVSGFFSNWLMTMCEDSQHADGSFANVAPDIGSGSGATAWGDAALQCTYHMYQMYGDTRVISEHYAAMSRYMDFLAARSTNGITNVGGFEDWLNLGGGANPRVIDTAFYAYLSGIMSDMAGAIGKTDDAAKFRQLHDQVKAAFASNFINADGSIKDSSQTAYALAFTMGLIPDALHDASATAYVNEVQKFNWHLATGFIGTPRLLPSLHMAGHDDVAYKLLEQDTYPGWLFQVKLGATTMWERWDGWTPDRGFQTIGMNSFNHYAFGAVGEYLYSGVAGIDTDGPSFDKITIRPEPGGDLTYARSSYNSIHGLIVSSWKTTGKTLSLDVTIPANTTATVYVPCNDGVVTESGVPAGQAIGVKFLRKEPNACVYSIGSGTYHFVSPQA